MSRRSMSSTSILALATIVAAGVLLLPTGVAAQISATPAGPFCCGTSTDVTFCDNCSTRWTLKVGNESWTLNQACKTVAVKCPETPCPSTISWSTQSHTFGCPSGGNQIKCQKCDQNGKVVARTHVTLNQLRNDPAAASLHLVTADIVSYSEVIEIPGCPSVSPKLIGLDAQVVFGRHPLADLVTFEIQGLVQDLESFTVCGISTGPNRSTLAVGEVASGTIDTRTGAILGNATVIHRNTLLPNGMRIANLVTGRWDDAAGTVMLEFHGPSAVPSEAPVEPAPN